LHQYRGGVQLGQATRLKAMDEHTEFAWKHGYYESAIKKNKSHQKKNPIKKKINSLKKKYSLISWPAQAKRKIQAS